MKSFTPATHALFARALLSMVVAGVAASLAGCGPASDAKPSSPSPSKTVSAKATTAERGFTIRGDGVTIDATTSAALLPSYSQQALSVRIMGAWVDRAKAQRANKETDPAEKKKLAMDSFGTLNLQVSAGKAEPGTYQMGAEGKDPQSGTIVIGEAESAGLAGEYTSKSGTLTVKSVRMDGKKPVAIEGAFDGQFGSSAGDNRAFSGQFWFAPKNQ